MTEPQLSLNKLFNNIKKNHLKKIDDLLRACSGSVRILSSWFKNLTNIDIPKEVIDLLSLGPKFSICPNTYEINIVGVLGDLEQVLVSFNDQDKDCFRAQFTNTLTNFINKNHNNKPFLNNIYNKTKLFLKDNPNLYIY